MKVFLFILCVMGYAGIGMFMDKVMGWPAPVSYYTAGFFAGVIVQAIADWYGE